MRSILASEFYVIIYGFDIRAILNLTMEYVLAQSVQMILYTDLKLLYNCLFKLNIT